MSSVPPNIPPGAPPPYDPKTQWRIHREQQKAAWRAQREAWKAQRQAWKSSYIGAYGPRVPSVVGPIILIGIGVVALLLVTGYLAADQFWAWYRHWWPLLLIGAGLAMLGEWALDMKRDIQVRRSGNVLGILILVAFLGLAAAGWHNFLNPLRNQLDGENDNFFNFLGLPQHDYDLPALSSQIAANSAIEIQNPRGDVSVTAGDGSTIEVSAHEVAFASSDAEAKKIFDAEAPHLTVSGNTVLVKADSNSNGRINLAITVPKTARVTINSGRGGVTVAGLGAGLNVTAHGDVHLSDLAGPVDVRFSGGRNDFSVHQLQGDLTANGTCSDVTLSAIKGKVTQSGDILGDVRMESVSGPIHLHTSVTELEVASLTGDLSLNSDDLRVTEARGQVRVITHSKDIDLSQIYGDTYVENRDGRISVEPAGAYAVDAKNRKGNVEVTLPLNASATVNGSTHNGDIETDFGLAVSGEEDKKVTGKIGSGTARIVLSAENGDINIKKGSSLPAAASLPKVPSAPKVPTPPGVPHMKAEKALPAHPISQ
jgi:DUF4097 and DUF4098 domain-containing protein YvlB